MFASEIPTLLVNFPILLQKILIFSWWFPPILVRRPILWVFPEFSQVLFALNPPFCGHPDPRPPPRAVAFIQASPRRSWGSSRPRAQRELVNSSSAANGVHAWARGFSKKEGPSSKNGAKIEFTRRHDRLKQKNVGSSKKNMGLPANFVSLSRLNSKTCKFRLHKWRWREKLGG